jgi:hypothetical protein
MLTIDIDINIILLFGLLAAAFGVGYLIRGAQVRSAKDEIYELEKEVLNNNAQILNLEKERANLIRQMKDSKIPVITMKSKDDRQAK